MDARMGRKRNSLGSGLQAEGLTKSYAGVMALDSIDLEVPVGVVIGLLGPNGAGKTTLIRILSTVIRHDAGSFSVAGVPHTRPGEIRRRVGVLPESAGYPRGQTGEEWLTFYGRLCGWSRADARSTARRLLSEVGLADRGGALISTYSQGMRRRLGIARALVNDPRVVFLDEPTLGLDPLGHRQTLELAMWAARERGVTVVLSTHVLADVEATCERVIILNRGRIAAQGTVAEVARRAAGSRRAVVRVPPSWQTSALELLSAASRDSDLGVRADGQPGVIVLTLPAGAPPEAAHAPIGRLLAAGVPVYGFALEEGGLSDAFLEVTEGA
jgi:ABC-2 type transport system ATP-binding protein